MTAARIRLNLAISPLVKAQIERLQRMTDGASITEVIRRALAIYEEVLWIRDEGGKVTVENQNGNQWILGLP